MGLIRDFFGLFFGGGSGAIRETVEVFRENAESAATRSATYDQAALAQFAAEFQIERKGWFDRFVDGLNRLPRPLMAFGCVGLIVAAMVDPLWFSERMAGLALVPEPLWWLLGVVVSFFFGARHQAKGQDFQKSIAATIARTPQVVASIEQIRELRHDSPGVADTGADAVLTVEALGKSENAAFAEWKGTAAR
ncbi:holin family protein [Shimia thalassica]|uniref:holin family protein n=1 Tax=Shimia thalassica TaxID=1715693 RepID=UPI0026E38BF1|nr:holin family protein [Shimia thalassica]MDO6799349.1 holin family protein [Shimia thalassica]